MTINYEFWLKDRGTGSLIMILKQETQIIEYLQKILKTYPSLARIAKMLVRLSKKLNKFALTGDLQQNKIS